MCVSVVVLSAVVAGCCAVICLTLLCVRMRPVGFGALLLLHRRRCCELWLFGGVRVMSVLLVRVRACVCCGVLSGCSYLSLAEAPAQSASHHNSS